MIPDQNMNFKVKILPYLCSLLEVHMMQLVAIDQFRAAVYEHVVIYPPEIPTVLSRQEALDVMMRNLKVYKEQAIKASSMGARIIVFPEYGLYGLNWTRHSIHPYLEYIPNVNVTKWNPCNRPMAYSSTEVQRNLSCIAKNASIYLVANIGAKESCYKSDPNCPPDMHYQFSANVVYGPNGDFIARYFKCNLCSVESYFDKPRKCDMTSFETPFGRFGTFTSSAIIHHDPAVNLIKVMNVTNIVYPTAWQDDLPLMSAIEFHSAFAEGMLINLLAANLHLPSHRYHGSGLYWPTGTSINASYYYNPRAGSQGLLVVDDMRPFIIPPNVKRRIGIYNPSVKTKVGQRSVKAENTVFRHNSEKDAVQHMDQVVVKEVEDFEETVNITIHNDIYTAKLIKESYGDIMVCQNSLCCYAEYEGTFNKGELYVIAAFDGMHTLESSYYFQACVFIKCANSTVESCGTPTTVSSSYMSKMSFSGNFSTSFVFPEVLTDQRGVPGLVTSIWYFLPDIIIDAGTYGGALSISMLARDYSRDPPTSRPKVMTSL